MKKRNIALLIIGILVLLISSMNVFGATGYEYLSNYTVSYLPFEEVSGLYVTDITGKSLGGNITGSINRTTGILGNSLNYTTNLDVVYINKTLNYASNTNFTFNFWINLYSTHDSKDTFLSVYGSAGAGVLLIYYDEPTINYINFLTANASQLSNYLSYRPINNWIMMTWVFDSNLNSSIYVNGTLVNSSILSPKQWGKNTFNNYFTLGNHYLTSSFPRGINGRIDEFSYYNISLNSNEISFLYNNGTPTTNQRFPFTSQDMQQQITFINQTPTDLTNTNLFSTNGTLRIIYNVTNIYNGTPIIYLNYTTNNSRNYFEITNGTVTDPTLEALRYKQSNLGVSANNQYIYDINADNDIYPLVNLLPFSYFVTTTHTRYTINGTNDYLKFALYNMSFENSQYLELDLKSNNSLCRIFYCNSSYSNGNLISTSNNCFHFGTSSNQTTYNHTHGANVGHNLYAFTLNSSGYIGTVKVSENGFFAVNKQSGTSCDIGLIPNRTRPNTTELTLTGGAVYTVLNYTPDTHLHFFNTTFPDNFKYQLCVTNGTNDTCSSFRTDNLDITNFPPIINIITPNNESINITSRYYNITWSYILTGASNVNFSVFLYNSTNDLVRNLSINQSNTSFYNWDIVSSNITQGTYYVGIYGLDNNSLTGFEFGDTFYIYNDAEVNVTAKYYFNNATISNFNITLYDFNSSLYAYYNGTSYAELNIIKGHSYNILIDHPTYSYISYNFTTNTNFNNITFFMNLTNSIYFLIYNYNTFTLINTSTQIYLLSDNTSYTFITNNGTYLASNLSNNFYIVSFNNSNYSVATYSITVNEDTSQQLIAYLIPNTSTQFIQFYVKDLSSTPLQNITINIQKLINSTYIQIGNKLTDISGYTYFYLEQGVSYKFTLSGDGYNTRTFLLEVFSINSPYIFKLTPSTELEFNNIFDDVSYILTPTNLTLTSFVNTFTIQSSSPSGKMLYTYINCNGVSQNISGFPNGATAQAVGVVSSAGQSVRCNYTLSVDGYDPFSFSQTYNTFLNQTLNTNTSLYSSMQNFKTQYEQGMYTLLAFIIIIFFGAMALEISGNQLVSTFLVFIGIIFFGFMGWIDISVALFIGLLAGAYYFLSSRGG